ncbi:MAG: hypothetical protein GC160_00740 [Acidobacteria bacterium]|nr:hypothetical protein [Acidobacteriota bacterium]
MDVIEKVHASESVVARGVAVPMHPEETARSAEPRGADLYLEVDGVYRWYEQGDPTDAAGKSLRTAVEAARLQWPGFQLIELDGRTVETESESEIPERYADDDLVRRR